MKLARQTSVWRVGLFVINGDGHDVDEEEER
jgi:hypothetical protein